MQINPRVVAQIDLKRAQAADGLSKVEQQQRSNSTIGKAGQGRALSLHKAKQELQSQVDSWKFLLEVARTATEAVSELARALDVEKEFPEEAPVPAPERTVAWLGYSPRSALGTLVCNQTNGICKRYRPEETKWSALTSEDLSDGGFCDVCGTDVLA